MGLTTRDCFPKTYLFWELGIEPDNRHYLGPPLTNHHENDKNI